MEFWKASDEIHKMVRDLIGQNHPDLATIAGDIIVVFREKARKSGGQTVYGTVNRASSISNALLNEDHKFILVVGADQWENTLTGRQKEALLDYLLCACRADEDQSTGDVKIHIARPDFVAFRENIERYGIWYPKETNNSASGDPKDGQGALEEELEKDGP